MKIELLPYQRKLLRIAEHIGNEGRIAIATGRWIGRTYARKLVEKRMQSDTLNPIVGRVCQVTGEHLCDMPTWVLRRNIRVVRSYPKYAAPASAAKAIRDWQGELYRRRLKPEPNGKDER